MRRAIVIGAGFGGLALAIRLQSAGVQTMIVEARDKPGGRAYHWHRDGHVFDAGPTVITDPDCLRRLWRLSGDDMTRDVTLVPVKPFYALDWPDGTRFDYSNDDAALFAQIEALNPADVEGYKRFLRYSAGVYEEGYVKLGTTAFESLTDMLKAAPALARYQAWRSVYSIVSKFVADEHLRQALSFHTLLVGGNKAPVDWAVEGDHYASIILDTLAERLIPDIRSRIRTRFHYSPSDFQSDLFAHLGSAFSLEPVLRQSAWLRPHNRDDKIRNLYFVGAGTHPGAGIPGVVGSAEATARLMLA